MSAFWSDACSNAIKRPLPVLRNTVYAFGGTLVSALRVVLFVGRLVLYHSGSAADAAVSHSLIFLRRSAPSA
jgi:hypothetical protein